VLVERYQMLTILTFLMLTLFKHSMKHLSASNPARQARCQKCVTGTYLPSKTLPGDIIVTVTMDGRGCEMIVTTCFWCGHTTLSSGRGPRERLYCSNVCRQRAYRARHAGEDTEKNTALLQLEIKILKQRLELAEHALTEARAEIVRLTYLLNHPSKKRR
jgi:hypothetical protein